MKEHLNQFHLINYTEVDGHPSIHFGSYYDLKISPVQLYPQVSQNCKFGGIPQAV